MRRLFARPESIQGDRIYITDKDDVFYLSVVLRMNAGNDLYVSDGTGKAFVTKIAAVGNDGIELDVVSECPVIDEYGTSITLYQGLPKGSKMDEIVRKSTELGVCRIVPVRTARSVSAADGVSDAKLLRWRRIAEEAARQSRRARIPEVEEATVFENTAAAIAGESYDLVLILFELEEERTLKSALREGRSRLTGYGMGRMMKVAVFIGPEGGFEREEVDRLLLAGAESVTIGESILRTETAGPAAIAMILYEYDL